MSNTSEFLIFGTENCKFCKTSKETLDKYKMSYTYVDLTHLYGDNWRQTFTDLVSILKGQRTIPIIFKREKAEERPEFNLPLTPEKVESWTLLGTYNELLRYLDSIIDLDADY